MIVRSLSIIALSGLLVQAAFAQTTTTQQADQQFAKMAYATAAPLYEKVLQQTQPPKSTDARSVLTRLGYCYRQLNDTQNAERVYRDLLGQGTVTADEASTYLYYAQALASNGKYKEAQEAYETYASQQPGEATSPLSRDVSALMKPNAGTYRVKFLDINTTKAEFSPTYYRDGLVFVTGASHAKGLSRLFKSKKSTYLDLYYVPERDGLGTDKSTSGTKGRQTKQRFVNPAAYVRLGSDDFTPRTANDSRTVGVFGGNQIAAGDGYGKSPVSETERFNKSLNTKYHEGPATFSRDGSMVIFTRNNYSNGQAVRSADGVNKLKLYTAQQTNGVWSGISELPFNSNEYSTGHPALSRDGQLLYFASDMPGGFGGTDLYLSRWEGNRWSVPVNMGPGVNTKGDELFPFVDDKNNIYFASNGLPGLGGMDLFYVPTNTDGLANAGMLYNLGEPFNSASDDFGIVTDGKRKSGYFSSNRKRGGDDDDIYRFDREGSLYPCRQLTLRVYDEQTKEPLPETPVVIEGGEPGNERKEILTDSVGNIRLCLDAESDFLFTAMRVGYVDTRLGFSASNLVDDGPSRLDMALERPLSTSATIMTLKGEMLTGALKRRRGQVTSQADGLPLVDVQIRVINECTNGVDQTRSDESGNYSFTTLAGCSYRILGTYEAMATKGSRIKADGTGDPNLVMFGTGDVVKVDDIYYDKNKSAIRPDAALELDKLVSMMERYPHMAIELRSYTDSRGTTQHNQNLSAARAKAAISYIASKGVAKSRLKAKGFGESDLVNECADGVDCPEEEHQQNRRTEIKILRIE